jgi:hypothetical protein
LSDIQNDIEIQPDYDFDDMLYSDDFDDMLPDLQNEILEDTEEQSHYSDILDLDDGFDFSDSESE